MRLIILLLGLAVLCLIPFFIWGDYFDGAFSPAAAAAWLRGFGEYAWLVAIALLVSDVILPVPATAVMASLGLVYGPVAGGVVGAVGAFLSGALAYGLCRLLGRRGALRLLGRRDLRRGERLFARIGGWAVAGSRWLPVFPEVIACMAGLIRMPVAVFLLALACGCAPLAFAYAWVGHAGSDRPLLTVLLSALLPLALWPLLRALAKRRRR